jgi:glycosyltransferase involved in cell wall biosynthesis
MSNKVGYIPKEERKKILLLCDDIRMHSGIATMAREIVTGTAHRFNWFSIGAGVKHPDIGKVFDLSEEVNKLVGIEDASVLVLPNEGYGNADLVREIIRRERPDAVFIFTDPRYWIWLFEIEREIRSKIPIFYLNIWDDYPAPLYNKDFYRSVDLLMAISKQTKLINELVLGDEAKDKVITYVPHGINENFFYPITENTPDFERFVETKSKVFAGEEYDFVVFYNSRNIRRKSTSDLILAYRNFCDIIGKEKAKRCVLVLHTELVLEAGTDLLAVKNVLCDPEYVNVLFSTEKLSTQDMNILYNLADVTVLPSSNEGWGLSLTESMMAGTMIIGNVTGGMQDQMRFQDEDGNWIEFSPDFPSNHRGTYKRCGKWAVPVFPTNISLVGSPLTPYIFDDRCSPDDIATAIKLVWELSPEQRKERGLAGHQWVKSDESGMSARIMCQRVIDSMERAFGSFQPRPKMEVIKVTSRSQEMIPHKLTNY